MSDLAPEIEKMVTDAAKAAALKALEPAKSGVGTSENQHVQTASVSTLLGLIASVIGAVGSEASAHPELVPYFVGLAFVLVVCLTVIKCAYIRSRTEIKKAAIAAGKTVSLLAFVVLLGGCSHEAAKKTTTRVQEQLEQHKRDTEAGIAKLHERIRSDMRGAADREYESAVASITEPGGKADVAALQALQNLRIEKYELIENEIARSRAYFAAADLNAANAMDDLENLQNYFDTSAKANLAATKNTDELLKMLTQLRKPKKEKTSP